jgi:hypothetical protein
VPRRAACTTYFLNRTLRRIALIGKKVRFPETAGVWMPLAAGDQESDHVVEMLAANYPEIGSEQMATVTLLTDFDVEQFERCLKLSERS